MVGIIYQIRCLINNKVYIGSSHDSVGTNKRWKLHLNSLQKNQHHSIILQRAWNKYGEDTFVFEVLLRCDSENCLMYEQIALNYYQPEYNIALDARAPMLGRKHSKKTRTLMSNIHRGHSVLEETRTKIRTSQQGSLGNNAKLNEQQVCEIRDKIQRGEKQTMIANEFGVSTPTITDIKNRKSWRHV